MMYNRMNKSTSHGKQFCMINEGLVNMSAAAADQQDLYQLKIIMLL